MTPPAHAVSQTTAQERFRALLDFLPWTDDEAAKIIGVPTPTVARWRRGETAPHPLVLPMAVTELVQAYLGVSLDGSTIPKEAP